MPWLFLPLRCGGSGLSKVVQYLVLVRHSLPEIDPAVPGKLWHLSAEGERRCVALAGRLSGHGLKCVVSSGEPKAVETAQIVAGQLGLPRSIERGLHEHDRSNVSGLSRKAFQEAVARLFEQPEALVFGAETAVEARERFASALSDVLAQYPTGSIAVVTHGTVLSLFVGQRAGLDPYALWQRLGLPCFVILDRASLDLVEVVPSVVPKDA